uniref:C-JID domain-containing protein n=1 Tax=Brassica oleracea TaxID=3712 RepID=A0A3P6DSA0_BRAOL|nr:unnamed protein product [Brassica oleracea]
MYLNMSEINEPLSMDENSFQRMRNLKLLHFYKPWWWSRETGKGRLTLPDRGLHHFPRKLRLLRWDEYPSKCMPFNFRAESLVEIRMEYSKLEKLWEGTLTKTIIKIIIDSKLQTNPASVHRPRYVRSSFHQPFLGSLKEMDMSYSADLKEIPDLSKAINVKKLNLRGCKTLVALPSSIGNLSNLNIEWLYLEETALEREEDSSWIENIPLLERLYWKDVPLSCMPPNFNPEYMKYLKMRGGRLKKLWGGVKSLENLSEMDLSGCEIIIQSNPIMAVIPGGEVPMYFTHRASGSSLSILLSESSLSQEYIIIKACIVMRVPTFQEHSNSLYIQPAVNSGLIL